MREGYLYLETYPEMPGLVRVWASDRRPTLPGKSGNVRYIARYRDVDTGKMHAHLALRRELEDINHDLYRVDLPDAMAAIEADAIPHERDWIDPEIDDADLQRVEQRAQKLRLRYRRLDTVCRYVGIGALMLLALNAILVL
jgi:hypothetical protein